MKYQVVRYVTINAGIETVRPYVADFTKWAAWSPGRLLSLNMTLHLVVRPVRRARRWSGKAKSLGPVK